MSEVIDDRDDPTATVVVGDRTFSLGFPLLASGDTPLKLAATHYPFEAELLEAMTGLLEPADMVVDVGAGFGNHAIYLATIAECQVTAYEPDTVYAEALRANVARNGLDERVVVRQASALTLDDQEFPARVRALRIGLADTALEVLQGARALVQRDHPIVFIDCGDPAVFGEIYACALELDYLLVGSYGLTPTLVFDTPQRVRVDIVADSLLMSTERLYALRDANRVLHEELSDRRLEYERVLSGHERRHERAAGRIERLELALFRAQTDAQEARQESQRARTSFLRANEAHLAATELLMRTEQQLSKNRRALRRAKAERDALRQRRAVRFADRIGRMSRLLRASGSRSGSDR